MSRRIEHLPSLVGGLNETWLAHRSGHDEVDGATAGAYTLAVRGADGAGAVQPKEEIATLPDGVTGWQRVTVGVA